MSANVTGGPSHWRANLDELSEGVARLREATEHTMQLAGRAATAGGVLAGVTILTGQGATIGANTVQLAAGLTGMRAEVETLATGVEYAVAAYLESEAQITHWVTMAATPGAVVLSMLGATTDMNVSNDVYELAVRGTSTWLWTPIESAFTALDQVAPGSKLVTGHAIGWMAGLDDSLWNIDPTQRTYGMVARALEHYGLITMAPYDVQNVTAAPGTDGWQSTDPLSTGGSTKAMQLLQDYAYEPDTVTVAKLAQPDGTDAYAVMYAGTTPLGDASGPLALLEQEDAFGATGVVEAVAADSVYVEDATFELLATAGVPAGATIIPMGYSQGGTHAMNVAMSPKMKAKYDIPEVLTVAAPTGHRRTDELSTNYVHIEHEHDKVTALTGASNEARLNRTTIEVAGYPERDVPAGVFGAEHNFSVIDEQLGAALKDPEVAEAAQIPLQRLDMKMGGAVAIQQFQLERQQASPIKHPQRPAATRPSTKFIGIRPLEQWMTPVPGR